MHGVDTAGTTSGRCEIGWQLVAMWLGCLFLYNAAATALVKRGGAALHMAVSLLITPVTNMTYSISWVMGKHAEPIHMMNVIGMLMTVAGILVYRLPSAVASAK